MNHKKVGALYIVATPIGNLQDMTFRAIAVLKQVDCIAAEDTRHSAALLQHYGINTPTLSLHGHNERDRTTKLLLRLQQGESIALISDAGTPLISDPGYYLVHEAKLLNIAVIPIPGPSAVITALSAAGLPTDRFLFEGFLPVKKARQSRLETLRHTTCTMIFYEAPHRILDLLKDIEIIFGQKRKVVIARELTKKFETIRAGTVAELVLWVAGDTNQQRGEIVVLVEGEKESEELENDRIPREILTILLSELPVKQAVDLAAKITGGRKNILYELALQIKK